MTDAEPLRREGGSARHAATDTGAYSGEQVTWRKASGTSATG